MLCGCLRVEISTETISCKGFVDFLRRTCVETIKFYLGTSSKYSQYVRYNYPYTAEAFVSYLILGRRFLKILIGP